MIQSLIQKFKQQVQDAFGKSNNGVSGSSPRTYTDPSKLSLSKDEWLKLLLQTDLQYMSY